MNKLKVLELFGGIGACSKALEKLGIDYEIVDYVEIDKYAVKSFNAMHNTNFEPQDIITWNKQIDVDLIMHGSPCQDFSLSGKQAGGDEGSGTRSSLMYETIRITKKLKPKYVIWENVKNLLSKKHKHNFDKYLEILKELGYKNYYQVLNSKDYGIPQNRERVFTISIRNDIEKNFVFPEKQELKLKLKDMLEDNVDGKYYIEDDLLQHIIKTKQEHPEYTQYDRYNGEFEQLCRVWKNKTPALHTKSKDIKIYEYKKQLTETIINVKDIKKTQMLDLYNRNVVTDGLCQTVDMGYHNSIRLLDKCRIRKLTSKECFRLMGVKDEDYEKCAKNQSDASLYHLAGDSIVVNVLMAIFNELLKKEGE